MAVINILKDGTVIEDMSTVTVPEEIVKNVYSIHINNEKNKSDSDKKEMVLSK